ncbi:MAG: molybdopterin synthase sulfur carrier subunit [Nitriliruptorales bacterium]|nr:molybdopterin synthase sulfur carrier subunit [Nitriliruptorales bacterium]
MAVQVRFFAALRDAAGTDRAIAQPGPLADVLEQLCRAHGDVFRRRVAVSTVIGDGTACRPGDDVVVEDGAEIALLPPVSGGAG